jgi:hypothetical protein
MTSLRITAIVLMAFVQGGLAMTAIGAVQAAQFSAELVNINAAGEAAGAPGKIYVADSKVRIETPDVLLGFLVVDTAAPSAYLVWPTRLMFAESRQSSPLSRLFVPLDPGNPCLQWRLMADVAGFPDQETQWHCDAQDDESVDGRRALKFKTVSPRGQGIGWIDPELKFPLKIETEDGKIFAVRNIQQGPQPAELFEIPSAYRKLDLHKFFERFEHSDVWVVPAK